MLDLPPDDLVKLSTVLTVAIASMFAVILVIAIAYAHRLMKIVVQLLEKMGVHLTPDQILAAERLIDHALTVGVQGAAERAQQYKDQLIAHGPLTGAEKKAEAKIIAKSLAPQLADIPEEHLDVMIDAKVQSLRPGGLGSIAPPPGAGEGTFSIPPLAGVPSFLPAPTFEAPARPTPVPTKSRT